MVVSYTWKAHPEQGTKLGFIAQEVQPILPETVSVGDDANHTLGLAYTEFIPVIVRAIQQLAAKISDLATTVASFADHFTTRELTFVRATGDEIIVKKMCVQKTDGTPVCVNGDQLDALLQQADQSPVAADPTPQSSPTPVATTSPETSDAATSSPAVTESAQPLTEPTIIIDSPPLAPDAQAEPTPTTTTVPDAQAD